jgi:hypothetical protein
MVPSRSRCIAILLKSCCELREPLKSRIPPLTYNLVELPSCLLEVRSRLQERRGGANRQRQISFAVSDRNKAFYKGRGRPLKTGCAVSPICVFVSRVPECMHFGTAMDGLDGTVTGLTWLVFL